MSSVHSESTTYVPVDSDGEEIPRTPRRTPMACQFCRARKLKCDGQKPLCAQCSKRNQPCLYTPVPKQ